MPTPQDLVSKFKSTRLNDLVDKYAGEGDRGLGAPGMLGLAGVGAPAGGELPEAPGEAERAALLAAGSRALRKIQREGAAARLEPVENLGLEAIVSIEGRPAILIQNGRFFPPPDEWSVLEDQRDAIQETLRRVGRVELTGHPSYDWVGTGFLVAEDVIMTNRHVAEIFSQMNTRGKWSFKSGMTSRVDYIEELGAAVQSQFAIVEIIGVHNRYDLALFRVEQTSAEGEAAPTPLTIASRAPGRMAGRKVYTVGYPAWDGRRNDPDVMQRIFSNIYNVKRLQPGEVVRTDTERLFIHDCSTLGGNSGSCVIDLETHQVVGLHFGGRYMQGNSAVALYRLTNDALLKKADVNFA